MVYRIEIFTNQGFNPRSYAIIQDLNISFDYLTLEKTKVVCKSIDAEQGDWCRIIKQNGEICYEGIVDSLVTNENTTEISIKPLLSLLDVNSIFQHQNKGQAYASSEACLFFIFYFNYRNNQDAARQIPYTYVHPTTTPCPVIPTPTSRLNSGWNLATYILKQSGVVCSISLDIENKQIVITNQSIENQIVIEVDKDYVLKYEVSEGSNQGYNSVSIYSDDDSLTHQGTYVLHSDGTIDTNTLTDRIYPVVFGDETAQDGNDESGQSYALTKATEVLQQGKWVNEIKVTLANENKVIDVNSPIGTKAIVMVGDVAYETILTGYVKKEKTTELLFGTIRGELTKQMAISRIATGSSFGGSGGGGTAQLNFMPNEDTVIGAYNGKTLYKRIISWSSGAVVATGTLIATIGAIDEIVDISFSMTPSNKANFWTGSVRDGSYFHQGVQVTRATGQVRVYYQDGWSSGTMVKVAITYTKPDAAAMTLNSVGEWI